MIKTAEIRARELLSDLSLDEKIYQLCCQMVYPIREDYDSKRSYKVGNCRNIGHFLHESKGGPVSPEEITEAINNEIRRAAESNSHFIPPIEHGEALHGAQWGMATCFPQPIAMASMFDSEAVEKIADVIGKECTVAGVRQALTPVVNVVRDCRWGRTVETFGEDVLLNADMGAAVCRGYGYVDNDGSPLYPFGYGLSYTSFEFDKFQLDNTDNKLKISFSAKNTGDFDGEEVIQIYLSGKNCDVVMPLKELKAYKRFALSKKEALDITVEIPDDAFFYYNRQMKYGMHDGDYTVSAGTSSTDIRKTFEVRIRNGLILTDE